MATSYTRNLKLRVNSNLTADAKYNLERLDLLGSTFLTDSTDTLNIRSQTDIQIEPESADIGGSGTGGTLTVGTANHSLSAMTVYASAFNLNSPLSLLDQAAGGTRSLLLRYKSDVNGAVDTSASRTLSVDLEGGDRSLTLAGNLSILGSSITMTAPGVANLIVPTTGTLATLSGSETLTNKVIDAASNTLSNIGNASIAASAGIVYSKLNLVGSITAADIVAAAGIPYSKLTLSGSILNADVSAGAAIARSKLAAGNASQVLINDGSGNFSSEASLAISRGGTGAASSNAALNNLLPSQSGNTGKVLSTDGSSTSWVSVGLGSVTSVDLSAPVEFTVSGNPITTSGVLTLTKVAQSANRVWAGPTAGGAAVPTFRSLVVADIPTGVDHGGLAGLADDDHTQYHTDGRALTWLGTRSTNDLPEGSSLYFTDERAQDAVGNILIDSADLDFSYNDATPSATAVLTTTGVTATSYGAGALIPQFTVDAKGRITAASNVAVSIGSSAVVDFTEAAQDAVGGALVDSASIDFTYNDGAGTITAAVLPAGVNHNSLLNYEVARHIDHSAVQIATSATSGLTGGGTIESTRTLLVDPTAATATAPAESDVLLFADASNSNALRRTTLADVLNLNTRLVTATWAPLDGTTKNVLHSFGTTDISVSIYDIDTGTDLFVDLITRSDSNNVSLTSSQAPTGSGWRILVRK